MARPMELKCPYCGSLSFDKLISPANQSYVITKIDLSTEPPTFLATSGVPIDLYGCLDCGRLVPYSSALKPR